VASVPIIPISTFLHYSWSTDRYGKQVGGREAGDRLEPVELAQGAVERHIGRGSTVPSSRRVLLHRFVGLGAGAPHGLQFRRRHGVTAHSIIGARGGLGRFLLANLERADVDNGVPAERGS
jgi:hypothetical protein